MGTRKFVREFRREAQRAGYVIEQVDTSGGRGHLHATVLHGEVRQRLTLPSSPASLEHSIKYALDEIRRFETAHEATTQPKLHLHGPGGPKDADAQANGQPPSDQEAGQVVWRPARRSKRLA